MDDTWDWDHQKAETYFTVGELTKDAGLSEADRITLEFQFAADDDADRTAFEKALTTFGYAIGEADNSVQVIASIADIAFSGDAIWLHEERVTKMALARGYRPDGWGFWEP